MVVAAVVTLVGAVVAVPAVGVVALSVATVANTGVATLIAPYARPSTHQNEAAVITPPANASRPSNNFFCFSPPSGGSTKTIAAPAAVSAHVNIVASNASMITPMVDRAYRSTSTPIRF